MTQTLTAMHLNYNWEILILKCYCENTLAGCPHISVTNESPWIFYQPWIKKFNFIPPQWITSCSVFLLDLHGMQLLCLLCIVTYLTICCDSICCQFPIQLNDKPFFHYSNGSRVCKQFSATEVSLLQFKVFGSKLFHFKSQRFLSCSNLKKRLYAISVLSRKTNQYVCRICVRNISSTCFFIIN